MSKGNIESNTDKQTTLHQHACEDDIRACRLDLLNGAKPFNKSDVNNFTTRFVCEMAAKVSGGYKERMERALGGLDEHFNEVQEYAEKEGLDTDEADGHVDYPKNLWSFGDLLTDIALELNAENGDLCMDFVRANLVDWEQLSDFDVTHLEAISTTIEIKSFADSNEQDRTSIYTAKQVHDKISEFLEEKIGMRPDFFVIEDGDDGWAFFIEDTDTTSYVHESTEALTIEWHGTNFEPAAMPGIGG